MTVHTTHPSHHVSAQAAAVALAGGLLAAAAGYGVAALVLDEVPAPVIVEQVERPVIGNTDVKPGLYPGTNREERALMHRAD